MKKKLLIALPLIALLLGACSNKPASEPTHEEETTESIFDEAAEQKIKEIYAQYVSNGGTLTYEEWLATIKGEKGDPGEKGASLLSGIGAPSAELGSVGDCYLDTSTWDFYTKSAAGWVKIGNIQGPAGENGQNGKPGDNGENGNPGENGKSAYEIAVENGFEGTEEEWLESLKGEDGDDGDDGENGKSAYEIAVENGFEGTEEEWLESLEGSNGENGKSAYEIAVENGFEGTEEEWLKSLKGEDAQTPEKYVTSITFEGNTITIHYSDGTTDVINLGGGSGDGESGGGSGGETDPEDPEEPPVPVTPTPSYYNQSNAHEYDDLTASWSEKGHLYIHYLRTSATLLSDYNDWGVWIWPSMPIDGDGTLWGAVNNVNEKITPITTSRMEDIGGSGNSIDDFGVVYDIDLSRTDLIGSKSGNSVNYVGSTKIGFLMIQLSSMSSTEHWNSDGGMNSYIENITDGWTSDTVMHLYMLEGEVTKFSKSAVDFAKLYFPEGEGQTDPEEPEEVEATIYFFLDYNVADYDKPYAKIDVIQGQKYTLSELGVASPKTNDVRPNTYFVGWSYKPVIFSNSQLIDPENIVVDGYYLAVYGIWDY